MSDAPPPSSARYFSTIPDGYKPVVEYAWEGKQSLKALAGLAQDWAKALKVCGADLEKRVQQHPLPDSEVSSTLKVAVDSVKQCVQTMGLNMQEVNQVMESDREAFIEMRHKQSKTKREQIAAYEHSKKDLDRAKSAMNSNKKSYDSSCRKAEKAIIIRNDAKASGDPKLQAKIPKFEVNAKNAIMNAKKAEINYANSVSEVRKLQVSHRTTTYKVLNDLQAVEHKRIVASKATLGLIVKKHLELCETMRMNFEQALKKIQAVNPNTDLDTFMAKAKQDSKNAKPLALQEYAHHGIALLDTEGIKPTFVAPDSKKPPPPGAPGGPAGAGGPPKPPGAIGSKPPPPKPMGANPAGSPGPRGPPAFAGAVPPPPKPPNVQNEPSSPGIPPPLPAGQNSDPTLQAKIPGPPPALGGRRSSVSGPQKTEKKADGSQPVVAKAEFEFAAEEATDLGFQPGDYIIVTDRSDPEWWGGHHPGRPNETGEFPVNYVKIVQDPAGGMLKQARALYDYSEKEEGDLKFSKDDIINVLDDSDAGWWEGMLGDETGRFPSNYTQLINVTTGR